MQFKIHNMKIFRLFFEKFESKNYIYINGVAGIMKSKASQSETNARLCGDYNSPGASWARIRTGTFRDLHWSSTSPIATSGSSESRRKSNTWGTSDENRELLLTRGLPFFSNNCRGCVWSPCDRFLLRSLRTLSQNVIMEARKLIIKLLIV